MIWKAYNEIRPGQTANQSARGVVFLILDQPVIDFLESDGEILTFLEHVYALVDHHVERFIERGFTHLQIAFGCTGGQHRSVYSAEATAKHLRAKYPGINICVTHREQTNG